MLVSAEVLLADVQQNPRHSSFYVVVALIEKVVGSFVVSHMSGNLESGAADCGGSR